jgi:Regulator of chromosome condensation (RCC1) repeat
LVRFRRLTSRNNDSPAGIELSNLAPLGRSPSMARDGSSTSRRQPSTDLSGSVRFSFVSLENVLISSSEETSPTSTLDSSPSDSKRLIPPLTPTPEHCQEESSEDFTELWAFGANQCGQLGLGDTHPHAHPQRIHLPTGTVVTKLAVSQHHSVALTASGEAYVWGSNANGQFKQMNYQYFSTPTRLKLGHGAVVMDVAASGPTISVIAACREMEGELWDCKPYLFSRAHSNADDSPSTQLVTETSDGWQPAAIWSADGGNTVLVGTTRSDLSRYFEEVKALRLATQLYSLLKRLQHAGTGEWVGWWVWE